MTSTAMTSRDAARQRAPRVRRRLGRGRAGALAAAVPLAVLAVADAEARHTVLVVLEALGFLAAGGGHLLRWRVTGNPTTCRIGIGLVLLGLHRPASVVAAGVLDHRWPALAAAAGSVVVTAAAVTVLRAFPDAGTRRRPVTVVLLALALGSTAASGLSAAVPALTRPAHAAACLALALLWAATAVAAWRSDQLSTGYRRAAQSLAGVALVLAGHSALAAVPDVLPAAGAVLDPLGHLVVTGAAGVALLTALRRLTDALVGQERYVAGLLEQLAGHERQLQQARACLHDARAAVAGVRAAGSALRHVAGPARTELEESMAAEVARVERLLRLPDREVRVSSVDLDRLVRPLVVSHRERGLRVRWVPAGLPPVGVDGDALAVIAGNLLGNALVHAPGALCTVTVEVAERLTVTVADDGPGLPPSRRAAAFEAGERSTLSPGEGLGLAISRDLARRHGGDLVAADATVGCRFVLTLPLQAAVPRPAPPRPRTAREAVDPTPALVAR